MASLLPAVQGATPKLLVGVSIFRGAWDERHGRIIQFKAGRSYQRGDLGVADPWRTPTFFVFLESLAHDGGDI